MLQPAERLRFLREAAQQLGAGESRLDDLERDRAARLILLGLVDGAHAAFADQANDAVAADRGRQRRGRHRHSLRKRDRRVRNSQRVWGKGRRVRCRGPLGKGRQVLRLPRRVGHSAWECT